jgi:hypothetical protein
MPLAPNAALVMRIVADTNTVLSGLLWQGAPRRLLDLGIPILPAAAALQRMEPNKVS